MKYQVICVSEFEGDDYDTVYDVLSTVSDIDIIEEDDKAYIEIESLEEFDEFVSSLDFYTCEYVPADPDNRKHVPILKIR